MSASKPIGDGKCRLVIASPKGEQTIAFCTEADAIRYLHRTLLEACGGGWLNGYVGLRVHVSKPTTARVPSYGSGRHPTKKTTTSSAQHGLSAVNGRPTRWFPQVAGLSTSPIRSGCAAESHADRTTQPHKIAVPSAW